MEFVHRHFVLKKVEKAAAFYFRLFFSVIMAAAALILQLEIPASPKYMPKELPYYTDFCFLSLGITLAFSLVYLLTKRGKNYLYRSYFIGVSFLLLAFYNMATIKFLWLKVLFFPSPEQILYVFIKDQGFLLKCILDSSKLLGLGLFFGIIAGLITGVLVGWSRWGNYWIDPVLKMVGPIPSTAFVPIALSAFATSFQASVFLISLAVWFPVAILTNSGIQNVKKSFFEVASTLGASSWQQVFLVAIPAALPSIFVGLFNGTVSSFLTLMTAEMLGVKYGIGWYINWQREIMGYANVYAGLITIGVYFSLIITVLFKVRDHLLKWQKGFIKW